jgi:acetoin utilization deacetylase AcuC-like enzyme
MKTKIIYSEICLEYGGIAGPENAARVLGAVEILKKKKYDFVAPQAASDEEILLAHSKEYVEGVKNGTIDDPDTPAYDNIYKYAKLSAGAAIMAAKTNGFSLMRPPGHHCGISGKALGAVTRGFCYFNNLAIAVRALGKITVIIDIDGHHGNGTQEIFTGDDKVTYISLHRKNVFPQTGSQSCGNYRNYPLEANCGGKIYFETFKKAMQENTNEINTAEIIAVSAGFDSHQGDLVSLGLVAKDYFAIGKEMSKFKQPVFFVLEGGYNGEKLGNDVDAFLKGFET